MLKTLNTVVAATLFVIPLGLFLVTLSDQFDVPTFGGDVGPAFAPRIYLVVWMALAAIVFVSSLRQAATQVLDQGDAAPLGSVQFRQLIGVILVAGLTALAMTQVGFVVATIPGFFLFGLAFGYRKVIPLSLVSVLGPLAIWAIFTYGFELILPRSPWFHEL